MTFRQVVFGYGDPLLRHRKSNVNNNVRKHRPILKRHRARPTFGMSQKIKSFRYGDPTIRQSHLQRHRMNKNIKRQNKGKSSY